MKSFFSDVHNKRISQEMEMSSAQWLSDLGLEDPAPLISPRADISEPTPEQLAALLGYHNDNINFNSNTNLTDYANINNKIPVESFYEKPSKQLKTNNNWDQQSSSCSKVSISPSIYVPNSQQIPPQQLPFENYITSPPKLKGEAYQYDNTNSNNNINTTPDTPSTQIDFQVESCVADVTNSVEASESAPGIKVFRQNHGIPASNKQQHSSSMNKASAHSQDHIMAERKRREILSQRFIALSAIVPGLKKMDKASILSDAIKYVKQLQERLKVLEDQLSTKIVQSVVYVKKSEKATTTSSSSNSSDGKNSSSHSSCSVEDGREGVVTPKIEVRVVDRNILIRIHCQKKKGLALKALAELEKLELTILNANILSFSETTLDITSNAQMEEGCELSGTDILKALQSLLSNVT